MNGGYFTNAGVFLVDALFGIYIFLVMLRFLFQLVRADFYNPLSQAIVTATNPPLRPMRRVIPPLGAIDTSTLVLMVLLQLLSTWITTSLVGVSAAPGGLIVIALAELVSKTVWIFIGAVIIQVIASWVAPGAYNPLLAIVDSLTAPLMQPIRRLIPPLGGLDLSPLFVILGLQLMLILVVAPLRDLGIALA